MLRKIQRLALRVAVRTEVSIVRAVDRLRREELGQAGFVVELILLGLAVLIAAAVFAFWKAGGMTWLNNTLQGITTY